MIEHIFELKVRLPDGRLKIVEWTGRDGSDAEQRFADAHRTDPAYAGGVVLAWRWPRYGLQIGYRPGMLR